MRVSISRHHSCAGSASFADAARKCLRHDVKPYGLPDEEINVEINGTALSTLGLSVDDIARTLALSDSRTPAGKLASPTTALTIDVAGDFGDAQAVRDTFIKADFDSVTGIRISDVATVTKSEAEPPLRLALSNGRRSVFLAVEMKEGYQVDKYSKQFDAFLEDYRANAADGLTIETTYDQSGYTEARLAGVAKNIIAGVLIVVAVLFVTLGWRAALIVALSLPLCTLLSMVVSITSMYPYINFYDRSRSGSGLLVDGSIVVTDEIRKHLLEGDEAIEAMQKAVKRMTVPLVSATATTVLAFTPMAILQGPSGDFLGSLATCVIVMLVMSLVLALSVTAALGGRLLPGAMTERPAWWRSGIVLPRARERFAASDRLVTKISFSLGATRGIHPPSRLCECVDAYSTIFPGTDRDQMYLRVEMPRSAGIEATLELVRQLDEDLRAEPLIRRVDWSSAKVRPPSTTTCAPTNEMHPAGRKDGAHRDENQTNALIRRLQKNFDRKYPQAQILVLGIDQGRLSMRRLRSFFTVPIHTPCGYWANNLDNACKSSQT